MSFTLHGDNISGHIKRKDLNEVPGKSEEDISERMRLVGGWKKVRENMDKAGAKLGMTGDEYVEYMGQKFLNASINSLNNSVKNEQQ